MSTTELLHVLLSRLARGRDWPRVWTVVGPVDSGTIPAMDTSTHIPAPSAATTPAPCPCSTVLGRPAMPDLVGRYQKFADAGVGLIAAARGSRAITTPTAATLARSLHELASWSRLNGDTTREDLDGLAPTQVYAIPGKLDQESGLRPVSLVVDGAPTGRQIHAGIRDYDMLICRPPRH